MPRDNANKYLSDSSKDISDSRLTFECKQALLRRQYAEPLVDDEWEKFCDKTQLILPVDKPVKRTNSLKIRYFSYGSLAGVAAVLLLLLTLRLYNYYEQQRPITIFAAKQRNQEITININNKPQKIVSSNIKNDPYTGAIINIKKADFRNIVSKRIQTRSITTPYGKDYSVILNDGTQVILNADSKLTFPTKFSGKERVVKLEGEAYFKIAKNPQMPFIVKTDKMDTRALGTEFYVKAYKGTEPHVTLIEGVVDVNIPEINKNIRMSPNEEISMADKTLKIKNVDPEYLIQWKDGFFYYDNVALGDILLDIGRWYNINIEISKPKLMAYRLHFVVKRDANIDDVVDNLNNFRYLNAVKNGNKITIREK